jgi:uncharacterized cupredoxin-like copper-binding protein
VLASLTGVACSAREAAVNDVTVQGTDYAFDVPETLPPGQTAFTFANAGQVPHEMILVRLKEGVTLPQVLQAVQAGSDPAEFTEAGTAILIAPPGDTARTRLLVDLLPGRTYALVCNFTDEEGQPPHVALGMVKSIEVAAGEG